MKNMLFIIVLFSKSLFSQKAHFVEYDLYKNDSFFVKYTVQYRILSSNCAEYSFDSGKTYNVYCFTPKDTIDLRLINSFIDYDLRFLPLAILTFGPHTTISGYRLFNNINSFNFKFGRYQKHLGVNVSLGNLRYYGKTKHKEGIPLYFKCAFQKKRFKCVARRYREI